MAAWSLLGIIALTVVVATALGAISGILVPLIVAVIFGALLEPLVGWLEARRVRPVLAAVVALLVAIAGSTLALLIVVRGLFGQAPQIYQQMRLGWSSLVAWGRSLDLDAALLEQLRFSVERYLPTFTSGLVGAVSGTFSGLASFALGTFFAVFLLFFMLRDLRRFPAWLAAVTGADLNLTIGVADAVKTSLRGYFKGITITALVTAPIFMVPLVALGVPLAVPIFILYFALSFIPFLGAWITGAVAVLVAFGSEGPTAALIIAATFVISNGTIQSAVSSWALGSALRIHPVVVLLATMIGGTFAGMLGMVLAAPLVAATIRSVRLVRGRKADQNGQNTGTRKVPSSP